MQATLSHYRILEQIGAGGMGVVYRAHDERLDRDIALKVLPAGSLSDASARKRFHKEALLLSKLNHPNIATVHEFDTEDDTDFLVEEFIEGLSLDVMLASGGLSETEIRNLGPQLAEGLAAAHEHGIIHRDLKPANVRVTPDARLKILDFGLAQILRREATPTAITQSLTETQSFAGTLPYMAPEQLLGARLDARTDVWAAGCVLYEMATGRRPFLGSGFALTEAVLHQPPPDIGKLNPGLNNALAAVIMHCLAKDPQKRYSSAREIALDLRRSTETSAASKPTPTFWYAALATAVLLMALAGAEHLRPIFQRVAPERAKTESTVQSPTVPHELYLAGLRYLERWDNPENLDRAAALFQQAVTADSGFALGFAGLAEVDWARYRLHRDSRWIEEAEKNCRKATQLNEQLPAVYVILARIHNGQGQYNLALHEIQQALKLEPLEVPALVTQAGIYAAMGQDTKAEETYKKSIALAPDRWDSHYESAAFYYQRNRLADSVTEFDRALAITPDNAMLHATLGGVLQLLQRDLEAEQHLKRSIELQPTYGAYTNLGALYLRQKRWTEAAAISRKALGINSTDWSAWGNLALACEWLGRKRDAEEAYREEMSRLEGLLKVSGDLADVQAELGVLYAKFGLRDKSVAFIDASLARAPNDPSVLASAGEAYEHFGNRSRALDFVRKALARGWTPDQLEINPGFRKLILDSRFREIAREYTQNSNSPQQQP